MSKEVSLAVFDPVKAVSADLETKDAVQEFDHTTPEGEKALRSWVHRVRLHKGTIEKVRVATKAGALEFGHKVDDLARELTLSPQKIIDARMKPLDEIEDAKRKAAEAIVEAERLEKERIEAEEKAELERREAEVARKEAELKAKEDAADAEQRDVERVEREEGIADEAADNARKEAEEKAERERLAAIAAAEAETDRLAEVERKRIANEAHRENVEAEIFSELETLLEDSHKASDVLQHLRSGYVPHVTINY